MKPYDPILMRRLNTAAQRIQWLGDLCKLDVISHWRDHMLVVHRSNAGRQGISSSGILSYQGIRGEDDGDNLIVVIAVIGAVVGGAIINPPRADAR